jgi:hypothetical protein
MTIRAKRTRAIAWRSVRAWLRAEWDGYVAGRSLRTTERRMEPWRRWDTVKALFIVAVLFAFHLLDPFRLQQNTTQYSGDLIHRLVAAVTGAAEPELSPGKVDPATVEERGPFPAVVLWDDQSLRHLNVPWPAPYDWHAMALQMILDAQPRAVFVDIAFLDRRDTMDPSGPDLVEIMQSFGHAGPGGTRIPLFAADPAPYDADTAIYEWALFAEIDAAIPVDVPGAAFDRFGQKYPFWGRCHSNQARLRNDPDYAIDPSCLAHDSDWQVSRPTAACAIYAVVANPLELGPDQPLEARVEWCRAQNAAWTKAYGDGLTTLRWSTRAPFAEPGDAHRRGRCNEAMPRDFWSWLRAEVFGARLQICPPYNSYRASELLNSTIDARRAALQGRVVFYGADLLGIADRVDPPTHTPLPGVHLHAAAFDTFMQGAQLITEHRLFGGWFGMDDLLALVGFALVALVATAGHLVARAHQQAWARHADEATIAAFWTRAVRLELVMAIVAFLLVMTLQAFAYVALNLAPINFVGMILALLTFGLIQLRDWEPLSFAAEARRCRDGWRPAEGGPACAPPPPALPAPRESYATPPGPSPSVSERIEP